MSEPLKLGLDALVDVMKAAGEPTRLRLLALLDSGDLTVTDLTEILGQSQPRISRHLKLLGEAELIERYQEGAWAYFRLKQEGKAAMLVRALLKHVSENDPTVLRDGERLSQVKRQRAERAQAYFSRNAAEWDELRRLHAADEEVDAAVIRLLGSQPIDSLLDLGTGTGRILELLSGLYRRAIGVDASRDMLSVARANLDKSRITKATVRHADILNLPFEGQDFDLVTIHQVLHFFDQPEIAIAEAARMLRPGGRLVVIDLAPHTLEYLRDEHAHVRLGFSHQAISDWLHRAGLDVEQVVDLHPGQQSGQGLTVTVWLARDPRRLMASQLSEGAEPTFAGRV
ncbi:metalloregulator ArsR/SmtB family transcription factor [Rhizobium redzepovicii]|uniref:Metalloregulator ArsR/SmtB family transcription factor n=1 Tax=Rhizobium redzepovicii TaxID=2867518 RepID=A0AAW8NZ91_9HYPH|nr:MULTISPECIES: metalloregulator ArsR/SmtB family transcription factor [Rhizobium]MBY4587939.1 metalloregulator ArsR/SmtB family transcription factor [Rhizobium redzepovicii]MBY4615834.1 metalloregulator ArsR/SmtB family transcription factor [Rhizobium redzepovicii]MDF0659336.1 metalloregulator ArsR/SmtB family transcription factor [Rhizobium sp. BC49]MDR9759109.1 metalloregulator ArsR/SmtB family transcription factor [Rhizobium redzepovicii]MDR9781794.1 metalloregulator ArsR/SmtB family tran